jgi:histone H3/H4
MPGKGKVGKKTIKRAEIKRTEKSSLTRGGIRRLARRGGVKRVAVGVYHEVRDFVDYFLNIVVRDAAVLSESAKRKTITAIDVVYALKKSGRTIYGYGV